MTLVDVSKKGFYLGNTTYPEMKNALVHSLVKSGKLETFGHMLY